MSQPFAKVVYRPLEVHDIVVTAEQRVACVTAILPRQPEQAMIEFHDGERDIVNVTDIEVATVRDQDELNRYTETLIDDPMIDILSLVAQTKGLKL